ncbi:M20/M25/M40 family metallo-hydrolase [Fictibacillus sp. NRS-1165]|uniref:M20/M25/M40 family metallo-hydrolase n=1 Tax=Fictibacillus sp. NRS-1165 TaxID=3144463 RepID=UPI003D1E7181
MSTLTAVKESQRIAIRAEMNALSMMEENNFDFISCRPGIMHSRGRDNHTAILFGTGNDSTKKKDELQAKVRFMFQHHAEEPFHDGAEDIVQEGFMNGVEAVIGTQFQPALAQGKVGIVYGPMMAALAPFFLTIHRNGGHAVLPHPEIGSIAVASQIVAPGSRKEEAVI